MPITPVRSGGASAHATYYNVQNYGIFPDGNDYTTAIAALQSAVNSAGGGVLFWPRGTYVTGTQSAYSHILWIGEGTDVSIILLAPNTNADLIAGSVNGYSGGTVMTNPNAANATGSTGGIYSFGFINITLDGNKANQSGGTGICLHVYGFGYTLQNVSMRNSYGKGWVSDWNGGSNVLTADTMSCFYSGVKVHDNGDMGIDYGGPHDSTASGLFTFTNGSHGGHIGPNATGLLWANAHSYQPPLGNSSVAWIIEGASGQYSNFVAEGSDTCNLVLLTGDCTFPGARIYGITGSTLRTQQTGVQLGQAAGLTPYAGSALQSAGLTTAFQANGNVITGDVTLNNGGSINFANEASNFIDILAFQTSGNHFIGSPAKSTTRRIIPTDSNVNDGCFTIPAKGPNALNVNDRSVDIFNVSTSGKQAQLSNSTILRFYSDSGTTRTMDLGTNGTLSVAVSATAVAIANSAAIVTAIGISRVAPTGNVTGCTLLNGSLAGQRLIVRNESAFTVLFAIAATSKIADADGTTNPIPANRSRTYEWSGSLWYQTN